jgi:hypothetical protein
MPDPAAPPHRRARAASAGPDAPTRQGQAQGPTPPHSASAAVSAPARPGAGADGVGSLADDLGEVGSLAGDREVGGDDRGSPPMA